VPGLRRWFVPGWQSLAAAPARAYPPDMDVCLVSGTTVCAVREWSICSLRHMCWTRTVDQRHRHRHAPPGRPGGHRAR
jgi:hypothetical protein